MCCRPSQHSPARRGPGFQAVPAIVILFQQPHCTQVLTFLYGRRSLCSGTGPEGKAAVSYRSEERVWNLQNKLGSEPWGCSLWEWSGEFEQRPVCSLWQQLGFFHWWEVIYSAGPCLTLCLYSGACRTTCFWALLTQRMDKCPHGPTDSGNSQWKGSL